MADLVIDGTSLTLALSRVEHLEGFRGDLHAPLAAVPGVVAVGTRRGSFGKDFAAVHGKGPAVVVEFVGQEFERWVLTVDDPDAVVARVSAPPRGD